MAPQSQPDAAAIDLHRHRCEVRQILRWRYERGQEWVKAHFEKMAEKRGAEAVDRLIADCRQQWRAGNTGHAGEWRETAEEVAA